MSFYLSHWTNLRAEPCETLCATCASPSGAEGCSASVTREDWLALYDLAEEKGEHVRLDWRGEEPPSNMHGVRAVAAPLVLKLKWTTLFSYRLSAGKQINLLELESLISLLRRSTRAGIRKNGSWYLWIRAWSWEPSPKDGRAHGKFIFATKTGARCLAHDSASVLVWVPTW